MMRSDRKRRIAHGRRLEENIRKLIEIGRQRGKPMDYARGELGFVLAGIDSLGAEAPPVALVELVAKKLGGSAEAMLWARGVIPDYEVEGFSQILYESIVEIGDDDL